MIKIGKGIIKEAENMEVDLREYLTKLVKDWQKKRPPKEKLSQVCRLLSDELPFWVKEKDDPKQIAKLIEDGLDDLGELEEAQNYIERMAPEEKEEMDLRSFLIKFQPSNREVDSQLLIRVIYHDNKYGEIESFKLDKLIALGKIKKFLRSGRWVTIGVDPIRGMGGTYNGHERRKPFVIKFS